ncbi:Acyl-CoA hydrolase [Syntrophus gentianae]|uniref:Acyl-CoA hydrolase n=1 Tax=Syntrophus gentianae TaxID=43775 RepID=A0A1H8AJ35_9BACT|nr:bifunctional acetyl-CoA hydrolase/transferase family protein/GNAT family N-acetyltransferase [Syntrophus gentianae]SEM69537.1 Acyl-CoA hydrolase [Syntrophus gentianae]
MILNWQATYQKRLVDAASALAKIRRGARIFIGSACGEPQLLVRTLLDMAPSLADIEIIHFLDAGTTSYNEEKYTEAFRHNALFIGTNTRAAIKEGNADYTPVFLSEIPLMIQQGAMPIDVALISVSPPDSSGYVSLGVSVDITKTAAEEATYTVAEVNPNMPRTLGDSFLHVSEISAFVKNDTPIAEFEQKSPDHIARSIGQLISDLIDNESTLQTGVGKIPASVFPYLCNKKDLGIHTETFSDGLIDLIEAGVVTCRKKTLNQGKVVAAFCMGTRRLYDYVHNNPLFEFRPCKYVNDPYVIAQNDRMVSINSALTVDLTGQVCSDSLGFEFYSGIGGQVDFVRGSAMSKRGKSIMVLPSTTEDGKISRIVPCLSPGSGVVVTRGDIHYVVTEYGIAYVHGKSVRDRAMTLINIAHPDFRSELLAAAKQQRYIFQDQTLPVVLYPKEYEVHWVDKQGVEIFFRPVKATDERAIQELIYDLPEQFVFTRFFQSLKSFPHKVAMPLAAIDYNDKMAIAAVIGKEEPEGREKIVAIGRYINNPNTGFAEIAFTTHQDWQNRGVGTFLLQYLIRIAKEKKIAGFTADVLRQNRPMLLVFSKSGYPMTTHLEEGVYELKIDFSQENI